MSYLTPKKVTVLTLGCGCNLIKRFPQNSSQGGAYVNLECPVDWLLRSALG